MPWFWPALLFLLLLLLLLVDWGGFAVRKDLTFFRFDHFYTIASCERVAELKEEIRHLEESIAAYDAKVRQYAALCVKKPAPIVSPKEPIGVEEKVQPREELVIPDEVVDTSFMHGRWLCDTGLINSTTLEPVQVEFVFDKNGNGTSTVYEKNDRCSGKAAATFENNILHIEHDNLKCEKTDGGYVKNTINCQKNNLGKTECTGVNNSGNAWNAIFYKIVE